MRRAGLLLILLVPLALLLPRPALAASCSDTAAHIRFDADPKTDVPLRSETRFTFKFRWSAACDDATHGGGGVILRWEVHDIYNSTDFVVRRSPNYDMVEERYRDAEEDNWDFNATWITSSGPHLFNARVFLDDRQITESAPVTVTAAGEGADAAPAPSGGEDVPPQAGPVDLAVTVGNVTQAADIPSYITALYRYGLGVGVTIAMVMVVIGGFQYMASRGNPSAVGAAKSRITNAVLGLLLLLGSYTLLQTINPELVALRNVVVPEIQRVETLSENRCEDFDRSTFTVTPTSGRCGETGSVARRDGTRLATNSCTWGVCERDDEVCVSRGRSGFACVECGDVIDDTLEAWGLSANDAGCARFAPPERGGSRNVRACVFAEDSRFDSNDDVCAYVFIDCSEIERCGDYDAHIEATHGGTTLHAEELLIDQYGGGERLTAPLRAAMNFPRACNANPCGVSGGCHAEPTPANTALPITGIVGLPATAIAGLIGDFWDCLEGP